MSVAVVILFGCRRAAGSTSPAEPAPLPFDAETVRLAERELDAPPLWVGDAPLALVKKRAPSSGDWREQPMALGRGPMSDGRSEFHKAVVFGDDGMLKVIASTSTAFDCDAPSPPMGAVSLEATFDAGPAGDYYAGKPTPSLVSISIPGDTARVRDLHPSSSRIQMEPFHDGDEHVTLHFDIGRALARPDPNVPTTIQLSGRADATLCPSALALGPAPITDPQGPVKVTIGEKTFVAGTVLAFLFDDGKNPAAVSGLGFYEERDATCEAATRALGDNGGGVNGLQVDTGPLAVSKASSAIGVAHPVVAQVSDITAGGASFAQKLLTDKPLRGFVHIGAVELQEEGGAIYGTIHAETPESDTTEHAVIEGVFGARVCARSW